VYLTLARAKRISSTRSGKFHGFQQAQMVFPRVESILAHKEKLLSQNDFGVLFRHVYESGGSVFL